MSISWDISSRENGVVKNITVNIAKSYLKYDSLPVSCISLTSWSILKVSRSLYIFFTHIFLFLRFFCFFIKRTARSIKSSSSSLSIFVSNDNLFGAYRFPCPYHCSGHAIAIVLKQSDRSKFITIDSKIEISSIAFSGHKALVALKIFQGILITWVWKSHYFFWKIVPVTEMLIT